MRTGAARECTATLSVFPGDESFSIVSLLDEHGATIDGGRWAAMFDLSLAGAGDRYTGCADLVDIARHGHFINPSLPWEKLAFDAGTTGAAGM